MEEIQLSPKKKKRVNENGEEVLVTDSESGEEGDREERKSRSKSKEKSRGKLSKSKSKSRSRDKSNKKEGEASLEKKKKLKNNEIALFSAENDNEEEGEAKRLNRNRSEQMKKKDLKEAVQVKTTKSQNIKKGKKKIKEDKNNVKIRNNPDSGQIGDEDEYDDEPSLPVFRARKKKNNESGGNELSDGLTDN